MPALYTTFAQTRLACARQSLDTYYSAALRLTNRLNVSRKDKQQALKYRTMGLIAHDRCLDGTNTRFLGAPE